MSPALVASLIAQYGLPLAQQIFVWIQSGKKEVTAEDFAQLVKLGQYNSNAALAAAGIKLDGDKVVPT